MRLAATVRTVVALVGSVDSLVGVNDRAQLRQAEELLYERIRGRLGREGVLVRGDARIDDTVSVFLGNGDGTFRPAVTYAVGERVWRVTIADATGDESIATPYDEWSSARPTTSVCGSCAASPARMTSSLDTAATRPASTRR